MIGARQALLASRLAVLKSLDLRQGADAPGAGHELAAFGERGAGSPKLIGTGSHEFSQRR